MRKRRGIIRRTERGCRCICFVAAAGLCTILLAAPTVHAAETDTPAPAGKEINSTTLMYALSEVNVRMEPNTSAEVLGQLQEGDMIYAVELTAEGWYRVVFNGDPGYIRQDFLNIVGTENSEWDPPGMETMPPMPTMEEEMVEEAAGENDQSAENTDAPEAAEISQEAEEGGINIVTVLVLAAVVILIGGYTAIQIVKERSSDGAEEDWTRGNKKEDSETGDETAAAEGEAVEEELVVWDMEDEVTDENSK